MNLIQGILWQVINEIGSVPIHSIFMVQVRDIFVVANVLLRRL